MIPVKEIVPSKVDETHRSEEAIGASLEDGDKVKSTIFFRGREMAHPEIGRRILERLVQELVDVAIAESTPRMEGNQMHTILSRKPHTGGGKAKSSAATAAKSSAGS